MHSLASDAVQKVHLDDWIRSVYQHKWMLQTFLDLDTCCFVSY